MVWEFCKPNEEPMTYREQINGLFHNYVRKSNGYIEVTCISEHTPLQLSEAKCEWKIAEKEYLDCLEIIKSKKVRLDDYVELCRQIQTAMRVAYI